MNTELFLVTCLVVSLSHAQAKEPPPKQALADIDAVIEQALKTFQVPGVAVSVVVGDEVVLSKGYGLRDIEKKLPVTPETQMPIASVTKQFTVAALGTLVRQGKLEWDKPVREYLPDFRLHNEYATSHITPRDLVTHRTGLPRHDAVWYGSDLTREQLFQRLPHFELSRDLRVRFQYNNLMYLTAGHLGGQVAKGSWEKLVTDGLFAPLGMKRSNFRRPRELVPVRSTYFRLKDLAGVAIEFLRDASGRVDRFVIYNVGSENSIAQRKK